MISQTTDSPETSAQPPNTQPPSPQPPLPRRISAALLAALSGGVVPRSGIEHIVVGRAPETRSLLSDLRTVAEGGSALRVVSGRYGAGKSFLLHVARSYALARNFVVLDADLSPERRLTGSRGQGLATYRELVRNMSTRLRPEGGALGPSLQRWAAALQQAAAAQGHLPGTPEEASALGAAVAEQLGDARELVGGHDLSVVLRTLVLGHAAGAAGQGQVESALRWLRAEHTSRAEARRELGVQEIPNEGNWHDMLKLLAAVMIAAGHTGVLVIIDELVNLQKISHAQTRAANYEKLLSIYNDTLQGRARGLMVLLGATPQTLEDPRRGLYSYEALRTRLAPAASSAGLRDPDAPVIELQVLAHEEIFALLRRLKWLHATHHDWTPPIEDEQTLQFMQLIFSKVGARGMITPRDVTRSYLSLLSVLREHPDTPFETLSLSLGEGAARDALDIAEAARREDEPEPNEETSEEASEEASKESTGDPATGDPPDTAARRPAEDDEFSSFEI